MYTKEEGGDAGLTRSHRDSGKRLAAEDGDPNGDKLKDEHGHTRLPVRGRTISEDHSEDDVLSDAEERGNSGPQSGWKKDRRSVSKTVVHATRRIARSTYRC